MWLLRKHSRTGPVPETKPRQTTTERVEVMLRDGDAGLQTIQVIKVIRLATGLGLKDSKALVDAAAREPQAIPTPSLEVARSLVAALDAAGATATLDLSALRREQELALIANAKAVQPERKHEADVAWARRVREGQGGAAPPGRESIPTAVRHLVWNRDGGRCAKCGAPDRLEFDHIMPIAMGGSNTETTFSSCVSAATVARENRSDNDR